MDRTQAKFLQSHHIGRQARVTYEETTVIGKLTKISFHLSGEQKEWGGGPIRSFMTVSLNIGPLKAVLYPDHTVYVENTEER